MTREEVYSRSLDLLLKKQVIALELSTGFGKTKLSIDLVNYIADMLERPLNILLLIAKRVHKQTWKNEIEKWGGLHHNPTLTIECYESLKKHVGETYDIVIADEGHHLQSEVRLDYFKTLHFTKALFLSATFPKSFKKIMMFHYHWGVVSVPIEKAIKDNVLPEPTILLFPLTLDNKRLTETIEINPKVAGPVYVGDYNKDYWKYKKQKVHATFKVTPLQYSKWINNEIDYKKKAWERTRFEGLKYQWLKLCGDRLQFLAYCKNDIVYKILQKLKDKRTLTFCTSIEQTEILGKHCIHSKNQHAIDALNAFNDGKIKHITACQVLNEGVNLTNCQYGIFANINASEVIVKQRQGRLFRHKHPTIIIPYYKDTREEELVEKMVENYNNNLIKTIKNIDEIC